MGTAVLRFDIACQEERILLTQDRGLLKRSQVTCGYEVRSLAPRQQVFEVVRRFDLRGALRPYTRCVHCNGLLQAAAKAEILDCLPPLTRESYDEFFTCTGCGQIYWRGTHTRWLEQFMSEVLSAEG